MSLAMKQTELVLKLHEENKEMFALLSTIAVFSTDKEYAKRAEEMVKMIRENNV